jgi:hypothetical protein
MPPVFSTIRPTTINGKDHTMTLEQSIDLAELQADMAFDAYLAAFDEDAHPETLDSLETEALIARKPLRRPALSGTGSLGPRHPCGSTDPQGFDTVSQKLRDALEWWGDPRYLARAVFVFFAPDPFYRLGRSVFA